MGFDEVRGWGYLTTGVGAMLDGVHIAGVPAGTVDAPLHRSDVSGGCISGVE